MRQFEEEQLPTIPMIEMELSETDIETQIEDDWLPAELPEVFDGIIVQNYDEDDVTFEIRESGIDHDFQEYKYINELLKYIESTYQEHYSKGKTSAFQEIVDGGFGTGFCFGNIIKYSKRYGKKDGFNRKDILKIAHYAILALYSHDHDNVDY